VPPYVVAHDQTLAAIAEARPPSAAALRRVKGIGPAKIEAYGDEILEIVARLG
jgi:superfamily II DNA helicase RecQ